MRNQLLFQKKYNKSIARYLFVLSFIFSINSLFGQEIVVNKYAVENTAVCNQFDVTLEVIGNPPPRPQEVVLIIDRSGSMSFGDAPFPIDYAQDAAVAFVDELFNNNPTGLNKIAVVSFSDFASLEIGLTDSSGEQDIINAINSIITGGATNTEDGVLVADTELTNNGTFDCNTSRSIILLSDGAATRSNAGNGCEVNVANTECQTRAIQAGIDAQTTIVLGETYNQNIFTIGLTGAINGLSETYALSTLNGIQNAGAFSTEDNADLSGIYSQILDQLVPAATQLPGEALISDTIQNGFTLVANSLNPSKGTASDAGQLISWFVPEVFNETITLNYTIEATGTNVCGNTQSGTTIINYEDSSCNSVSLPFTNPNICVPCPEIDPVIARVDCTNSINYSSTLDQGGCSSFSDSFEWVFRLNGVQVGTSNTTSGTFDYNGVPLFEGNFTAELTYIGSYGSGSCTLPSITEPSNTLVLPITLSAAISSQTDSNCSNANPVGEIIVTASNGTPPYSFSIDGGNNYQPSGTFSNLSAGTYTIDVLDDIGCTTSVDNIIINDIDLEDPEIEAPNVINIEGCDENTITGLTAKYPYSASQSVDVKDTYIDIPNGYTASDDVEIASITYIDVITPNSSCPLEVIRTYTITDACGNFNTASQTINITPSTITFTNPVDSNVQSCDFANQNEVNTAFDNWVIAQSAAIAPANGCSPVLSGNSASVSAPLLCDGGSTTVTWTITDLCETFDITADFNLTAPTAISFTNPADSNVQSCDFANQNEVNTAFDNWVIAQSAAIAPTNGCSPLLSDNSASVSAPLLCDGGSTTVTWTITDLCETFDITADFNLTAPTAISFTNPADNNVQSCDFANQNEVNTAFDNWVIAQSAAIAPANGCSPLLSDNSASVSTPLLCDGGSTTVTWTITDLCETINTITADFNLTAPTAISFTNPTNDSSTAAEFDDPDPVIAQSNLDADIAAWVADQTALVNGSLSDGCAPIVTNNFTNQSIPFCSSGSITITWTITDLCETIEVSANYTFTQPDGISFTNPSSNTVNSCDFDNDDPVLAQSNLDADIAAWVANQTAIITGSLTGGSPAVSNNFTNQSIDLCTGGGLTITWSIDDICENINISATYTVTPPVAITFTNPVDSNVQSCDFANQNEVNTAFDNWVIAQSAAIAPANGCSPVLSGNSASVSAPLLCDGGSTTVTWTITDLCETFDITADFNLTAPTAISFTNPADSNVQSCDFANQNEVNTAFDNWVIAQSAAIAPTNGCSPLLSDNSASVSAPLLCDGGSTTVTWTITDLCETFDITADFNLTAPTAISFTNPADNNVQSCDFANQNEVNTAFDNWVIAQSAAIAPANGCSPLLSDNSASVSTPLLCDGGSTTVTWTITDLCETINTITADFNLTAPTAISFTNPTNDSSTAAEFDDPDPVIAQSNLDADIAAWVADQTALVNGSLSDGCAPIVTNNFTNQSIPFCSSGSITITWTITDLCETIEVSANYTFTQPDGISFTNPSSNTVNSCDFDNDDPVLAQSNLDADIAAWVANQTAIITGSLTGGSPAVSNNFTNQSIDLCTGGGLTITWSIDDICENINISATYTVTPPVAITFTNPVDDTSDACEFDTTDLTTAQAGLDADIATWVATQTSNINDNISGGCSPIITSDFVSQSIDFCSGGSVTITWTVADLCETLNQTATYTFTPQTATVFDQSTLPQDETVECDLLSNAEVLTATNSCGNVNVVFTEVRTDGDCPNRYSLLRTWTATDICGISTIHTQTVTVTDNTAPVLTLPANQTAECSDDLTPIAFGTATAIDNCDANPVITFVDVTTNGACSGTFTITRTWTATDACGNATSANQTISTSDTTAPEFDQTTLPGDITVECNGIPAAETLTATDNCGTATVTVNDVRTDGSCANNYTITRTYTATDDCGLTNTHIQTITVQDTIPPVFESTLPPLVLVVECDAVPDAETLTATDTCGSATVTVEDIRTDGDCPNNYRLARTWTATDVCGLTTTHTQIITVQDTTPPTFEGVLPDTSTIVECDAIPDAETLTAIDNCGDATVSVEDIRTNGDCPNNYIIARTWTATDACGLTTTHTQVITVQDTTAPVPTTTFEETLDVSCTDIPDAPELTFTDNCSTNIIVVFNETNSFDENVFVDYEIVRTWTVRDECDNEEVYTQTLQVALDEVITDVVAPDWCYDEGMIDMNSLLEDGLNTNGTWELLEGDPQATLNGNIFDPTTLELSLDFLPESGGIDYTFRYTTTNEGCISITEITMNVHADCVVLPCGENDVIVSKAVTPNGDAYNEFFEISGIELCGFQYEIQIFNRWGALIYESDNYQNDWNGTTSSGSVGAAGKVPNGTYYYIIKLLNSGLNPITGPVYLGTK